MSFAIAIAALIVASWLERRIRPRPKRVYEYTLQYRYQLDDGTHTRWRTDNHAFNSAHLESECERLNSIPYSRMEYRIARRPEPAAWKPITDGLTDEQRQARENYSL